ncbi:MAG TPA: GAF domain-containing SpoIIE family protein phosphatase [Actinopolymorphaceae bacterium]
MDNEDRLRRIESVTHAALAHLSLEDLLEELLERVRAIMQVDTAAILILDAASGQLLATAAKGLEEEVRQNTRIPLGAGFAGRIASGKEPVILDEVTPENVSNPVLIDKGIRSMVGVPMIVEGEVVGVLHVGTLDQRAFPPYDVDFLQIVAGRAALAAKARTTEVDRVTTVALQRSLMPASLPILAGLELASRYVPGDAAGVGGDWYDVFRLPSGRLGVVIGDVAGHGLQSAVVMGRLRSALRAYALESDDPADVLARLDHKAQYFESGIMATVQYGIFEPGFARLHLSTAGHPAPILAAPGQEATPLDVPPDLPIGVLPDVTRQTTTVDLPADSVLCHYTDGLIERRGRSLDTGLDQLCRLVVPEPVEQLCATVMARLVGADPPGDDIAVLACHRLPV